MEHVGVCVIFSMQQSGGYCVSLSDHKWGRERSVTTTSQIMGRQIFNSSIMKEIAAFQCTFTEAYGDVV